jgi:hypothetical protein
VNALGGRNKSSNAARVNSRQRGAQPNGGPAAALPQHGEGDDEKERDGGAAQTDV